MYDYIIVGFGVAGFSLMQQLEENKQNYIVFDNNSQQSTRIAGGMYNPVILKRFTPAWQAAKMLPYALLQFQKAELTYGNKYIHPIDIYRKLASVEEQNNWMVASDKPVMRDFMQGITHKKIEGIDAPFGFGKLTGTGIVNVAKVLDDAINRLKERKQIIFEEFEYDKLIHHKDYITYKDIKARKIVFAEGYGMKKNPFFYHLPLMGTKGEMLMVETETPMSHIVKSAAFLAPNVEDNRLCYVGATYNWEDKSNQPTDAARKHLEQKLQKLYHKSYKVVLQKAGIRPTVIDRRPLLGKHPQYPNIAVLNGMGTRGVILAPTTAKILFQYLEFDIRPDREMDIARFEK